MFDEKTKLNVKEAGIVHLKKTNHLGQSYPCLHPHSKKVYE